MKPFEHLKPSQVTMSDVLGDCQSQRQEGYKHFFVAWVPIKIVVQRWFISACTRFMTFMTVHQQTIPCGNSRVR